MISMIEEKQKYQIATYLNSKSYNVHLSCMCFIWTILAIASYRLNVSD